MISSSRNVVLGIRFLGVACALFVVSMPGYANAGIMVGIAPTTSGSLPSGPFGGDSGIGTNPPNMVHISGTGTGASNPSDVWDKDIIWNYTASSISPGDKLCINEEIMLFSPPTSTVRVSDWHERLVGGSVPLGWSVGDASISFKVGASLFNFPSYNVGLSPDGREIWFEFPPLALGPPGNPAPITLVIGKYIRYQGNSVITSGGGPAQLEVLITEQPSVPEPGSFILIAASAIWFVLIRRRPGR